jgi:hypothetical protein
LFAMRIFTDLPAIVNTGKQKKLAGGVVLRITRVGDLNHRCALTNARS